MQLEIGEFYERFNDALRAAVVALGGYKKVGPRLRPELDDPEEASQWLRHCLNEGRREKLSPEQVIWILREARAVGFHAAMDFVAASTGYEAKPVDAARQVDDLEQRIADGLQALNGHMAKLARLKEQVAR